MQINSLCDYDYEHNIGEFYDIYEASRLIVSSEFVVYLACEVRRVADTRADSGCARVDSETRSS